MVKELGDRVRNARYYGGIPRSVFGEVIKVGATFCTVRWEHERNGRTLTYWYRGRTRDVPATSLVKHDNLELVERKGGPW